MTNFRERITHISRRRAGDIAFNPRNPKRRTDKKSQRLTAVLENFGKAGVLLTYFDDEGTERFFDGNTRRALDPDEMWHIAQTDLSQKEVDDLVLFYDALASPDWLEKMVREMVRETAVRDEALTGMIEEIVAGLETAVVPPEEWPEYDESAADTVEYLQCPECGHKWPK